MLRRAFAITLIVFGLSANAADFDRAAEFPNLFLQKKYWSTPAKKIPQDEVNRAREALNEALNAYFRSATMPVVKPGDESPRPVPIFELLQAQLKNGGSNAELLPLIRSAIGKIYEDLYGEYRADPKTFDPESALSKLTKSKKKLETPATDIWGVGSDFDVLVRGSVSDKLVNDLTKTINSARDRYKMGFSRDGVNRQLIPLGDVKDYNSQIERATSQGGSVLDYIAFALKPDGTGEIVEPKRFPGSIDQIIRGIRLYADPKSGVEVDRGLQAARGMRPATELPWLELDRPSRERLERDVSDIGRNSSPGVKEQIEKGIRNSRFSGGHNSFYRSPKDSLEATYREATRNAGVEFPEFVESFPIPKKGGRSLNGIPADALIPQEEFFAETSGGVLYHGTRDQTNYLAILRNNFVLSKGGEVDSRDKQGEARFGDGVYTSPNRNLAKSYSNSNSEEGLLMNLRLDGTKHINIVDFEVLEKLPFYKKLLRESKAKRMSPQRLLSQEYGVDLIKVLPDEMLIMNSDIVQLPSLGSLLSAFMGQLEDKETGLTEKVGTFRQLQSLIDYAQTLGWTDIPDIESTRKQLLTQIQKALMKGGGKDRVVIPGDRFNVSLEWFLENTPKTQVRSFMPKLTDKLRADNGVYSGALEDVLKSYKKIDPEGAREEIAQVAPFFKKEALSSGRTDAYRWVLENDRLDTRFVLQYLANASVPDDFRKASRVSYIVGTIANYRPSALSKVLDAAKTDQDRIDILRGVFSNYYGHALKDQAFEGRLNDIFETSRNPKLLGAAASVLDAYLPHKNPRTEGNLRRLLLEARGDEMRTSVILGLRKLELTDASTIEAVKQIGKRTPLGGPTLQWVRDQEKRLQESTQVLGSATAMERCEAEALRGVARGSNH